MNSARDVPVLARRGKELVGCRGLKDPWQAIRDRWRGDAA
jgi:hypothetical protein